ncbi:cytolytic toxin-alpha-like [Ctenopharyngodon idella]|uniref:cytolytic toxin-alpha-like n=1 Tax=Ctenopharyngodon idella TaxID=7959 RepID=UPI00222E07B3|nr:cytolytic toxin-alpha-like [Ctenopharyngodon idella]
MFSFLLAMESGPIEVAALGRPLYPGMLYDCRMDSFIPGVTLWNKKSLSEDLDTRPQLLTDLKFSSSDSLSSKSGLLDVSASLKASFMGGLVEVGGSAKYLHDTKSSNQQSRVTMYYKETSSFEQLTMTQLGQITYPQVFDQKTATHVVTAVLYGAQAFMVFDRTFSKDQNKQEIEGELNVMVKKIPAFSIEGKGDVQMTEGEKKRANNISCTFHGDFHLEQNPTTYMEALNLFEQLPTLLKKNKQNGVPIKVWLYPLHLLDNKAAPLKREICTSLVSITEDIIEGLGEAERTCKDLSRSAMENSFSDIKERLLSFQASFSTYKIMFMKAVAKVLPGIREGQMEEKSLKDILEIHRSSPFNEGMLNQWLDDAKSELHLLSFQTNKLKGITIKDSDGLNAILLDPDIDDVVCLTFTSLKYEDPYLLTLKEYLNSDKFQEQDGQGEMFSMAPFKKWFNDSDIIVKMRENVCHFRHLSESNTDAKRICFVISAISDPSSQGSSIYLYEKGKLTCKQVNFMSLPPPIVKVVLDKSVSLKLWKSPDEEKVQYRVEYKQVKAGSGAEEQWLVKNTAYEDYTLTGLEPGKQYLIRYKTVHRKGMSRASDTVNIVSSSVPFSEQPVIVGGTGGNEFFFNTPSSSTFERIIFTLNQETLRTIQVTFKGGHKIEVGALKGTSQHEFLFDHNDKIVAATLWPNKNQNRCGGLEFVVAKSNGKRTTLSVKCPQLGMPVKVDVKSGKCYGIAGRSGDEIDALGFYFI